MAVVVEIAMMMINNDDDKYINRSFIKGFGLNIKEMEDQRNTILGKYFFKKDNGTSVPYGSKENKAA